MVAGVFENLSGKKFNRLYVLSRDLSRPSKVYWCCLCDCGAITSVAPSKLKSGHTKSCGCYLREHLKSRSTTHGMSKTTEFKIWYKIIERCYDPSCKSYVNYGGRGIKMHTDWLTSFISFYTYIGPRPSTEYTIDRINVNGDYEPGNVRWATKKQQANNTRVNRFIEYKGDVKTLAQWSEEFNILPVTLQKRLDIFKWPLEKALTAPIGGHLKRIEFNGELKTLAEWCRIYKINRACVRHRIYVLKWPLERALTEKPFIGKNQSFERII